ncbi:SAM-dependent methyltransferase [Streptacidiphilus pinicola]|uniref:SAM-dependent methyltransferase n=1 Tax=Streptacidiphilus pinicola TaxID=2219663 RepID=A0A2X0K665_9ACTN|nr:methyltransferase domain-containing protein [Streptacidiphilus pinicola]RAG83059.1 SAM-dependent methyltransferase [Streptacidiphilus pinicola]
MTEHQNHYTHGFHASVLRSHQWRTVENSSAYLLPELKPGQALLDVGCGPGTITAGLAERVGPGLVTAVDNSAEVLAQARQAVPESAGVRFETADVHALPFPDASFDVVHAHQVLQHVADPVAALREMHRVCRSGGVVAVRDSDYAGFTWYPAVPALDEWNALYHRVARANGGEPDAGRMLRAWALAAGFPAERVEASSSTWCFAADEDRGWWGGMWAERILSSGIADQAVREGFATRADLDRISAGWRAWAADERGWFSVLHGELICRA